MSVASADQGTFTRRIRLVIADRLPIVLQGLRSAFAAQRDIEIVASCSSGASCVEAIRNLAPDVALLADTLRDVTASEILAIARAENLSTRLVFFTDSETDDDLAAAIADGACGAISKRAGLDTLLQTLRPIAEQIRVLPEPSPDVAPAGKQVDRARIEKMLALLTDREREIMRLVSEGLSNKAIARQLNVSPATVKVHIRNIFQKLEINKRTVLTAFALLQRPDGFGTLSLAALMLAALDDAKASDPDNTFLDDDSIAYKDLEHGVFELWTKEAVPRHIIVGDPGETVVLIPKGSSISVSLIANSAARMEELHAAQQALLSNFGRGYGPTGSSTPYLFDPQVLQPINYTQTSAPATQQALPPLEFAPNPIIQPIKPPPPPPTPPSLNPATGPTLIDTPAFDTFATTHGTFTASSLNSSTLTFGISGGANGNFVLEGAAYNVAKTGPFGTLYLNSATGAFIYAPNSAAINALTAPTTESFTITVWDGTLSDSQTYTVTIIGTNDSAVISGTTTGAAVEAGGGTPGTPVATGTLTDTDVDNAANMFVAVTSPAQSHGGYGTFTMTAAGVWTYVLNNANPTVQALNAGQTLVDTFTVATIDGTQQVVTIIINGSNDPAVIAGATSGSVVEAGGATSGTPVATGALTDTDVDNAANTFIAVASPAPSHGGYGTFTMTAAGVWTYTLNNADPTVQALNAGGTLIDTFTVASIDGTTQVVTITINGSNDPAVISGATRGSVIEAGSAAPGTPVATGTLTDTDVDNAPNTFAAVTAATQSHGGYGTFTMTATGVWTYTLNNSNPVVQALNAGDTLIDTFTVASIDGTTQVVTITINGSNDKAVISGITTGAVVEAGVATAGTPVATGTLTDTDVDNAANAFIAVTSPAQSHGGFGTFTMTAAGVWTYTLNNSNPAVQALNTSDTLVDTFTVATLDGTTQLVTITIAGSNDAAVISGTTTGSVTEAGSATSGTPVATGTLIDTDVDNAANTFVAVTAPAQSHGGYGTFTMTAAGVWTFTLNNANPTVQALNAGDTLIDTFTVASIDGTTQVVTITIAGSNDAAVISGTISGSVTEAGSATSGAPVATGTLTDTDVDNGTNAFIAVTSPAQSHGGYGTFTMTAGGVWAYTLNNADPAVQALNAGGTLVDTFTVATLDGTTQVVTITIAGSNDAAVISGVTSGSVTEAGGASPGTPVATGTLTDTDVDNLANTFIAVTAPTKSLGGYGTFTMTAAGVWIYTLDNANATVQALDTGDTLIDTFKVASIDGTTQVITITIHGASDADPNDFDNLAPGPVVNDSQPPFVFGTPGHDSVAGGGSKGQIIYGGAGDDTLNGTGLVDLIYGGSGNDTIKGNGGDDTIYGGSGNDTINGNNGNDTIIGGYGADQLTGSNGDDVFVYLSSIDSNSTQFDTITDFASGSDKINLAAFGALAFLHLTPTSTSVPPHTLAWIYDPASNQTIVYVNPTDGSLDIGDAGLVEIHLQGVVSVAESDFIYEPAAATVAAAVEGIDPALLVTTASDGTVLTMGSVQASINAAVSESTPVTADAWAMPADDGLRFHFGRDPIDAIASVKLASFGEDSAYATEEHDDGAVAAPVHVSSIAPAHSHATDLAGEHFTFKEPPAHAKAGAVTTGQGKAHATAGPELPELGLTAQSDAMAFAAAGPINGGGNGNSQHAPNPAAADVAAAADPAEPNDTPDNGGSHGNAPHAPNPAATKAAAAADPADPNNAPGNNGGHGNTQHAPNPASAKAATAADPAEPNDTPGNNGSGHGNAPHAPNPASTKAAAAADPAEPNDTPGNGSGHGNAQHAPNPASAKAAAAADPTEPNDTPANGGGHGNAQHAPNPASAKAAAAADPADPNDTPANGGSHGNAQDAPNPAAAKVAAAADPTDPELTTGNGGGNSQHASNPAAAKAAAATDPADPGLTMGNSGSNGQAFHFKNQVATSNQTAAIEPEEPGNAAVPGAHGHAAGEIAAILETSPAALSQTEDPASSHVNNGQHNAAGHGQHDLVI